MNFKEWLIFEEIFPNKTATVYHRTCQNCNEDESIQSASSILTSDFKAGEGVGCMYGCGLYTTFAIESQFARHMDMYGKVVIKFTVTDLDKYLILQLMPAKYIHGKDYKISDQLKKLGVLHKVDPSKLEEYDKQQVSGKSSGSLTKNFYEENKEWMTNSIKGIIYDGEKDGFCLLKYPTVQDGTITMSAYAVAVSDDQQKMEELKGNKGWITSTNKASIKSIYSSPIENRKKYSINVENKDTVEKLLKSKFLDYTAKKLSDNINSLNINDISYLLENATDKDQMINIIQKYKKEITVDCIKLFVDHVRDVKILKNINKLTPNSIFELLKSATDKDKMAEILNHKIEELSDYEGKQGAFGTHSHSYINELLLFAKDRDQMINILLKYKTNFSNQNIEDFFDYATDKDKLSKIIVNKKIEFSDSIVSHLLLYATEKEQIAKTLGTEKISKLSSDNIYYLLSYTTDKKQMAKVLGEKNINKLSNGNVYSLLLYANDKDEIAEILGTDNINKLNGTDVVKLLYKPINADSDTRNMTYEKFISGFLENKIKTKPEADKIIKIINTNNTPEVQSVIRKYLKPQTIAAK